MVSACSTELLRLQTLDILTVVCCPGDDWQISCVSLRRNNEKLKGLTVIIFLLRHRA